MLRKFMCFIGWHEWVRRFGTIYNEETGYEVFILCKHCGEHQ